jgi:branched-chain amino acid transport system permease protein
MQWYDEVLQVLLIGIANGAIIALIALGYTLVYGIIELINFAHGDVFMIGTMISLTVLTWIPGLLGTRQAFNLPTLTLAALVVGALIVSIVVCAGLNVLIERVAYRRLRNSPRLAPLITAIGVSFILVNVGLVWKGASQVNFPDLLPRVDIFRDVLHINTLILFTLKDLFVIVLAFPLMIGLTLFVQRTRLGKAMRATAQDRTAAAMMGAGWRRGNNLRSVQQLGVVLPGLPQWPVQLHGSSHGRHRQHPGCLPGRDADRPGRRRRRPHLGSAVD